MAEFELPVIPNSAATKSSPFENSERPYFERLAEHRRTSDELGDNRTETIPERDARRLTERLPDGYTPSSGSDITFDPRLAYELALEINKPSAVFDKYGLSGEAAANLVRSSVFISTVKKYRDEIQAGGVSFALKAKIQAEDLLNHSYIIATDPEAPMAVRADLIKWTARVAGLEPKESGKAGPAGGFSLNITFAGDRPGGTVIEGESHAA